MRHVACRYFRSNPSTRHLSSISPPPPRVTLRSQHPSTSINDTVNTPTPLRIEPSNVHSATLATFTTWSAATTRRSQPSDSSGFTIHHTHHAAGFDSGRKWRNESVIESAASAWSIHRGRRISGRGIVCDWAVAEIRDASASGCSEHVDGPEVSLASTLSLMISPL